jgi:hypothetical protein
VTGWTLTGVFSNQVNGYPATLTGALRDGHRAADAVPRKRYNPSP